MAMFTKRLQERLGPEWTHLGMTGCWRDPSGNVYRTGTDSNAERVAAAFLVSHHLGIGERGDDAFREALVDWLGIRNVSREDPRYGGDRADAGRRAEDGGGARGG